LWRPPNATQALARSGNLDNELIHKNRFEYVQPWRTESPDEIYHAREANVRQFGKSFGYDDMTLEDGMFLQGPLSSRKGKIEAHRLIKVYDSIATKGYKRSGEDGGDINCLVLKQGNSFRFLVVSGHHRAAALTALGYESIPIRPVNPLIIEDRHVAFWPHVRRGEIWNQESALEYLEFLFDNDWPDWAQDNDLPSY
jgi:hypothetical protein